MIEIMVASASAFGTTEVVFVSMMAVVILLCVRALGGALGAALSRAVSHMLDGSIVALLLLFIVVVIIRFKTVG
jgi:putative effector of murein hydrolase LrgA (UPF0299 family)